MSAPLQAVISDAEATAGQEVFIAAQVVIVAEGEIADFLSDVPEDIIDADLARMLAKHILQGISELRRGRDFSYRSSVTLTFSTGGSKSEEPAPSPPVPVYELWYGTNRQSVMRDGEVISYSAERDVGTSYGICRVTLPQNRPMTRTVPTLWRRLVFGDRPMAVSSISPLGGSAFWSDLTAKLQVGGTGSLDAVVFLHGYKVSFENAAVGAAQLGADLGVPNGAMGFFSWPSQGRYFGYPADEAAIEASEVAIAEFLDDVVSRTGARQVHIIAHSMGNRGLLRALTRIANMASAHSGKPFGQIVLAAPDVDRTLFEQLHDAYVKLARRTTLYLSDKDLAVRASRFLHKADRVGLAPPVTVLPNIDTVNVAKVDLSFLGHGYHGECGRVLTDIHQLIQNDLGPERRFGLVSLSTERGPYWELAT